MHQRIFLAMGDPDFAGAGGIDGRGQPVPVAWSEITSGNSTPR